MRIASLAAVVLVLACQPARPPAPAPAREPVAVAASFGKTWDAVIDQLAGQNVQIRTMERASGFISAEPVSVPPPPSGGASPLADCGTSEIGAHHVPARATYNVVVRGDSARSTVLVTVRWISDVAIALARANNPIGAGAFEVCSTKGVWEGEFEQAVKARAEGAAMVRP